MTIIFTAAAILLLGINLWALRRYSGAGWSRILAGVGVLILFDFLAIATDIFLTSGLVLLFTFLEEVSKFAASNIIGLRKAIVRLLVGLSFGIIEVALSKSLYIATGQIELKYLGIFTAFCVMAVVMHGLTALYYTAARNPLWGILAATFIHALYNWVVDQAETIGPGLMALSNGALLLLVLGVYMTLFRPGDLSQSN